MDTERRPTQLFSTFPGRILSFGNDGTIEVLPVGEEAPLNAYFLRTTAGKAPDFQIGELVVLMVSADSPCFVLGIIEPFYPGDTELNREHVSETVEPSHLSGQVAENYEKLHLRGKKIFIEAEDEIRLKCGDGLVVIDKAGKVTTRGEKIMSRSKGVNKIQGGSVAIN